MNVNLMRFIDSWIGIPLCYITSLWYSILKFFGFRIKDGKTQSRNIMFISLAEMGNITLAKPAIKKAKKIFPRAKIFFLVFKGNEHGLVPMSLVEKQNVFSINPNKPFSFVKDIIRFLFFCRKRKIDTIINLEPFVRFNTLLSFWCGAKNRVGHHPYVLNSFYIGNFQTHKVEYSEHIHMSRNYMALVMALKAKLGEIPLLKQNIENEDYKLLPLCSTREEKNIIYSKLKKLNKAINTNSKIVVLNPNSSMELPIRRWPLINYCKVAKKILQDNKSKDLFIVVMGLTREKSDARAIINYAKDPRCVDFTGQTKDMMQVIHLFNISSVLVSSDCGSAHFSSLTGIKLIVFFGPGTPKLYGQLKKNAEMFYLKYACSPCLTAYNQRLSHCNNNLCIKNIKVEDVCNKISESL